MQLLQNLQTLRCIKKTVIIRNNWFPIMTKDIACFIRDNLNYIYTFSGEKYITDYVTLEEIEEPDPALFSEQTGKYCSY